MDAREAALRVDGATDQHELLFALVAWWQLLRHSRIANVIDAVADKLAVHREPIGTQKRAHAEWLAVAKLRDPADIRRLVDALWYASPEQALARLGPLAERDDPQVAPALLGLLARDCVRWRNARAVWDRIVALVVDARDVRMHDAIATALPLVGGALRSRTGDRLHGELEAARSRIPREEPVLDVTAERLVASLERELGVSPRPRRFTLDELLEQIYADPDADGPREVYADAIGGDIGHLIIEQLRSHATEPALDITRTVASQALADDIVDAILGPLRGIAVSWHLVRGFAEQLGIWSRTSAIRRHVGLPAWQLVTHIAVNAREHEDGHGKAVQLLAHPVMRRVRAIRGLPVQLLDNLAGTAVLARLESLTLQIDDKRTRDPSPNLAALTTLRRLGFDAWHQPMPPWLERLDFAAGRLAELMVATNDVAAWVPALRALGVAAITVEAYAAGFLRFRGDVLELDVKWRGADMLRVVSQAAAEALRGISRIVLAGHTEGRDELRDGLVSLVQRAGLRITIEGG